MKLEVKGVKKQFGGTTALQEVSVTFEPPHIYGLLGRNGAGKTTLLNLLTGRMFPTAGEILADGKPLAQNSEALAGIYSMSDVNYYPEGMRIRDVFNWSREFYPEFDSDYAYRLAKEFELDPKKKNNKLSTGYGSIFRLIVALACGAPVLLFDEPVLGLDAGNRELFYRELMRVCSEKQRLVIFSTHLIGEAAGLIDRAVILKKGRLMLDEDVENLTAGAYSVSGPAARVDAYAAGKSILGSDTLGDLKTVYIRGTRDAALPDGLEAGKIPLQKLFVELTGRGAGTEEQP